MFKIPSYVSFGSRALSESLEIMKSMGNRAFIVSGKHVAKSPMMEEIKIGLKTAGITYYVFDGITGEPTNEMIEKGVEAYKNSQADFFVGVGGGSALDSMKAIAMMSVSECKIAAYMGKEIVLKLPPMVAVPTTAGTGSEATKFTVITDSMTNIKMLLKGDCLIPAMAVINPKYTIDMPKHVTTSTGLDALTHAVEAYTSKKATALTDIYAISAVKRIMKYLPMAYKNGCDLKAREEMALAAYEAGVCINNSSVTIVHGMSRPIGALFHVPHGMSNAMLLPTCLGFALDGAQERFWELAVEIGVANKDTPYEEGAKRFLLEIEKMCEGCEVPTIQSYGIDLAEFEANIDKMSEDAIASGSPANTRKNVTVEDCKRLYRELVL